VASADRPTTHSLDYIRDGMFELHEEEGPTIVFLELVSANFLEE